MWIVDHRLEKRVGPLRGGMSGDPNRQVWPCKDGYVSFAYWSTYYKAGMISNKAMVDWMESEGMCTDYIRNIDWKTWNIGEMNREIWDRMETPLLKFFLTKTKAELHSGALKRRILLVPVTAQKDLIEDEQLKARGYWVEVDHPELGGKLVYPGAFARVLGADPLKMGRRAPLIGEHNQEIYRDDLKLSVEEMVLLKQSSVI
jgi:benzylsuccinate CoA-transferase BbsE subunit